VDRARRQRLCDRRHHGYSTRNHPTLANKPTTGDPNPRVDGDPRTPPLTRTYSASTRRRVSLAGRNDPDDRLGRSLSGYREQRSERSRRRCPGSTPGATADRHARPTGRHLPSDGARLSLHMDLGGSMSDGSSWPTGNSGSQPRFHVSYCAASFTPTGCRTINRFKTKLPSGRVASYEYPRYFFSNLSDDIRASSASTARCLDSVDPVEPSEYLRLASQVGGADGPVHRAEVLSHTVLA
jgi:hypothetical protein